MAASSAPLNNMDQVDAWVQATTKWLEYTANAIQTGQPSLVPLAPAPFKVEQVEAYFNCLPPVLPETAERLIPLRSGYFTYKGFQAYYHEEDVAEYWQLFTTGQIWKFLNKRANYGFRLFNYHGSDLFFSMLKYSGLPKTVVMARLLLWLIVSVSHYQRLDVQYAAQTLLNSWYEALSGLPRIHLAEFGVRSDLFYYLVLQPAQIPCSFIGLAHPPKPYESLHHLQAAVQQDIKDMLSGNHYMIDEL